MEPINQDRREQGVAARLLAILTPHKTIPKMSWTAKSRWDLSPSRVGILFFGLTIFGLGDSLLVQSKIGNAPWTVLAQGIHNHSHLSIGEATFLVGALILILWWPLRERPGFGTLANIVIISAAIQLGLFLFRPINHNLALSLTYIFLGIFLVGLGSTFYITTGLGPGPRDGLMTALHYKTGIRVARVRFGIELCAFVVGALLGGSFGLGTALFALGIGQSVAINLSLVKHLASAKISE